MYRSIMNKKQPKNIKPIFDYINQKDFFKLYSRNICLQISEIFFYYSMIELYKMRGVRFDELAVSKNGFADCYGLGNQFDVVNKAGCDLRKSCRYKCVD